MTIDEALNKIVDRFEPFGLDVNSVEWQTLETFVLAQQTNNKLSAPCVKCLHDEMLYGK